MLHGVNSTDIDDGPVYWVGVCRLLLLTVAGVLLLHTSQRQNVTKNIRVVSGGYVSFSFNSLKNYKDGKTLDGWTRFSVQFADTTDGGGDGASTGYRVMVRAGAGTIQADGGSPDLALSYIRINPSATTLPGSPTLTPITLLTDADQTIVEGGDPGVATISGEVTLDFDCGVSSPLLGKNPDHYLVDLIFTLVEIP